jgi:pimeloyl-ACP methyl ester carboxylesterase
MSPPERRGILMSFNSRRIRVNGVELNVIVEGHGPDVLLVHGFPDDHMVWRKQIPALVAAGYRVIAPDTRGCGASAVAPQVADYSIDRLVSDLVGLLDALGVRKVRVVGHDWGAVQGWFLALRHPERVERYVALSVGHPGAYSHGGLGQLLRSYYVFLIQLRGLIEFLAVRFNWLPFRVMAGYEREFARWKSNLSRPGRLTAGFNYYRANLRAVLFPQRDRVKVPVLGIWSSGDIFLTEKWMLGSGQYCEAGWQYRRLDGCNHWLQLEAPEALNTLLLEYLR